MSTPTMQYLTVAGSRIELWRGGEGPPLLYLHGAGGAGGWRPHHIALAKHFDVIAPSHPGFDNSDTPEWLDRVDDLAYCYLELLAQLKINDVHLVGHSLGGWVAAELAVRNTSRLKTLSLLAAAGVFVPGPERVDTFLMSAQARMRAMVHDPACIEGALAALANPDNEDTILKNQMTSARLLWQPRSYSPHLHKWLHLIDIPTLVLWGASDRVFPLEHADLFCREIPDARKVVIDACGHLIPTEHPQRLVAEVLAMTQRADTEAAV